MKWVGGEFRDFEVVRFWLGRKRFEDVGVVVGVVREEDEREGRVVEGVEVDGRFRE